MVALVAVRRRRGQLVRLAVAVDQIAAGMDQEAVERMEMVQEMSAVTAEVADTRNPVRVAARQVLEHAK